MGSVACFCTLVNVTYIPQGLEEKKKKSILLNVNISILLAKKEQKDSYVNVTTVVEVYEDF